MKLLDAAAIARIRAEIGETVEAAITFAEESPWPEISELLEDIYSGPPVAV
jgi:TPP-dependent pyruvate/acetoin dehydrogenase alpha subunit